MHWFVYCCELHGLRRGLRDQHAGVDGGEHVLALCGGHVHGILPGGLCQLRGRLVDGRGGDGGNGLHSVYCRHLQHRNGERGLLHDVRRQQLLEHGGRGGDELHSMPCE